MKSRAFRFALHVLFVGIVAAAAYVVWKKESEGTAAAGAARAFAERAHAASRALLEIKSAHPGYVAAGQGEDYWIAKVDALIGSARESLGTLRSAAQSANARGDLGVAEEALDDFEQMDRRARDYARNGQRLLASDLVFSDGIEKMDAAVAAVERARLAEAETTLAAINIGRRDALMAAAGAAAIGLLLMFVLVPLPPPCARSPLPLPSPWRPRRRPPRRVRARKAAPSPPPRLVVQAAGRQRRRQPRSPRNRRRRRSICREWLPCAPICRARIDTRALPPALERAARLLDASGLVIWVADPDGRELMPVIAHGYPQNLISRLGTIPRDAENVTAAAFRTGLVQTVKGRRHFPRRHCRAAMTPAGPVGVMAAEVLNDGERREATRAAAAIVAAQLATLMGPPAARVQGRTEASDSAALTLIPRTRESSDTCVRRRSGRSAFPFNVTAFLSRITVIVNSSPSSRFVTRRRTSDGSITAVPLKLVMTSPALSPALAAAESSVTEETSTPSFVPKYSASCGDSELTEIPRRLRRAADQLVEVPHRWRRWR